MVSCTGSRYSSRYVLNEINLKGLESIEIIKYHMQVNNEIENKNFSKQSTRFIDSTILINYKNVIKDSLKNELAEFFKNFPESRSKPYQNKELIIIKKNYLNSKNIDTINIDSIYQLPREVRANRNIEAFYYRMKFNFNSTEYESLLIGNFGDNIISYGFCCKDYESNILYRTFKGYTAYTTEYILDIEFQKRFVGLFNDILTKYNETNGTDYPLLDVDYEVWSGIISAP